MCFGLSSRAHLQQRNVVWMGKPWIIPGVILRTVIIFVALVLLLWLEIYVGVFSYALAGFPIFGWTIFAFAAIWLFSMLGLLVFWESHTYVLRHDAIEIRRGIVRLHSFVVTPMGFGDLLVYQSLGGRIFRYGDITVNSQGERQTKLVRVRFPFAVADNIRDIMGKPLVRIDNRP